MWKTKSQPPIMRLAFCFLLYIEQDILDKFIDSRRCYDKRNNSFKATVKHYICIITTFLDR